MTLSREQPEIFFENKCKNQQTKIVPEFVRERQWNAVEEL